MQENETDIINDKSGDESGIEEDPGLLMTVNVQIISLPNETDQHEKIEETTMTDTIQTDNQGDA